MLAPARWVGPRPTLQHARIWIGLTLGLVWQTTEAATKQTLGNVGLPPTPSAEQAALIREHSNAQLVGKFGGEVSLRGVVPTTVKRTSFDAMRQRQVSDDTHPILAQKRNQRETALKKEERLRALRAERRATPAQKIQQER
jgi:hypothetical protein